MKIEKILTELKRLSLTSNFYDNIYHALRSFEVVDPESYDFFVNDLEAQNFATVFELKNYLEAIYLEQ